MSQEDIATLLTNLQTDFRRDKRGWQSAATDHVDRLSFADAEQAQEFAKNICPWLLQIKKVSVDTNSPHPLSWHFADNREAPNKFWISSALGEGSTSSMRREAQTLRKIFYKTERTKLDIVSRHVEYASADWCALFDSLERWGKLPYDWDGENGRCPPVQSTKAARTFLQLLRLLGVRRPAGYVAGDGEIGYRWKGVDGQFASAGFLADGHCVGLVKSKKSTFKIDDPFNKALQNTAFLFALKEI